MQEAIESMSSQSLNIKKWIFAIASLCGIYWLSPLAFTLLTFAFLLTYFVVAANGRIRTSVLLPAAVIFFATLFFSLRSYVTISANATWIAAGLVGFSFLIFRTIHVLFELWRGQLARPQFIDLLLYFSFLPTYLAGPIELWKPFFASFQSRFNYALCKTGLWRVACAIPIKLLIVDQLIVGKWLVKATTSLESNTSIGSALVFGLTNYMRAYFDLWSYSEIAIGVCAILGIRMRENLDRPWAKSNIGDFWRSWHMSVTNWCTYHVYFPVFGSVRNTSIATASSMMVMALWHGVSWNWILWGAHHAIALVIYGKFSRKLKLRYKKFTSFQMRLYSGGAWLLTQSYVIIGYFYVGNGLKYLNW